MCVIFYTRNKQIKIGGGEAVVVVPCFGTRYALYMLLHVD
jgi:hypothetical protein